MRRTLYTNIVELMQSKSSFSLPPGSQQPGSWIWTFSAQPAVPTWQHTSLQQKSML